MATDRRDSFLQAEQDAHRLVEVLQRLRSEAESYKTAREALGQAATGVGELSTRCAAVAEQLGGVAKTLHSIGTPELLRGLESIAGELAALRQELQQQQEAHRKDVQTVRERIAGDLGALWHEIQQRHEAHRQDVQAVQERIVRHLSALRQELQQRQEAHRQEVHAAQENLAAQVAGAKTLVTTVRNLAIGSIGLSLITLALLGWAVVMLVRG